MNNITLMGDIEEVYRDLDTEVSLEEFREAVEAKVDQMGGLADEETAAMLVAHELDGGAVEGIADVEPGMEEVQFTAKVLDVGELRKFDRDDDTEGRVLNAEVADESGSLRITFWDGMAEEAAEELEAGEVLGIAGRPDDGYSGVEVNVGDVDPDPDEEIDVQVGDVRPIEDLAPGQSGVNVKGRVLDVDSTRTFDRDDGSEGRVANLTLGDPTGRIRVTLWDDLTEVVEEVDQGDSVEVVDGYVRERDGDPELHVNDRSAVETLDEPVEYDPDATPIADLEIGRTVDIAGVVRTDDGKRTFDRDDGSTGQVRNVRVQDDTGDVRVALWGEKADLDMGPGDRIALADIEIEDGWQDDLEASANWKSAVTVLDDSTGGDDSSQEDGTGLDAFTDETGDTGDVSGVDGGSGGVTATTREDVEFTGTVVQAGNPVILDVGDRTLSVDTDADVHLGEEVTVRGSRLEEGRIDASEVF